MKQWSKINIHPQCAPGRDWLNFYNLWGMLLIYSERPSARLQYICDYLFRERMGVPCRFTQAAEELQAFEGPALCYASQPLPGNALHIRSCGLLFEEGIRPQAVEVTDREGVPVFFAAPDGCMGFDVLAAAFYLLSRYEEYLPFTADEYGRFPHRAALAFRAGFLQRPLVDEWMLLLQERLQQQFPAFRPVRGSFCVLPTYDIDMAWSYRHKGWLRNLGGWLRHPGLSRLAVLSGRKPDPFDAYDWLDALHHKTGVRARYFFLLAERNGRLDKNILPAHPALQALVRRHSQQYDTGIHPSWQSGDEPALLQREIARLESMSGKPVRHSRQHYIRFRLPDDYRRLLAAGITDDYSMGYGSINGFRASVAASFSWYDLAAETVTPLRIHPFCFMDANALYEQRLSPGLALAELMNFQRSCQEVRGTLISIFHNNFLGTDPFFAGWREMYARWLIQCAAAAQTGCAAG